VQKDWVSVNTSGKEDQQLNSNNWISLRQIISKFVFDEFFGNTFLGKLKWTWKLVIIHEIVEKEQLMKTRRL